MRSSITDKWVCIATLIIFLYSFFIIGTSPVYSEEPNVIDNPSEHWRFANVYDKKKVVGYEWSTAVFIAPIVFFMFFCFMLFHRELEPVNRFYVRKMIRKGFKYLRWKARDGVKQFKEWRG